jgi:hypothetical protein
MQKENSRLVAFDVPSGLLSSQTEELQKIHDSYKRSKEWHDRKTASLGQFMALTGMARGDKLNDATGVMAFLLSLRMKRFAIDANTEIETVAGVK